MVEHWCLFLTAAAAEKNPKKPVKKQLIIMLRHDSKMCNKTADAYPCATQFLFDQYKTQ